MPFQLRHRHQQHVYRLQTLRVLREAVAVPRCRIAQLLQALARGGLAGAQAFFNLAPGRRVSQHFGGRLHALQIMFALDGTHQHFLAPIVMAVRGDAAVETDAVDQQVHVRMLGVGVARDQILVVFQSHAAQVVLRDLLPLLVGHALPG